MKNDGIECMGMGCGLFCQMSDSEVVLAPVEDDPERQMVVNG